MTEESIKSRAVTIQAFDDSIKKLFAEKEYFVNECRETITQKIFKIKIFGLAFNFAWAIRYVIDIAQKYEQVLCNSLLYDRFNENKEYYEKLDELTYDVDTFIKRMSISLDIVVDDNINIPTDGRPKEEIDSYDIDKEYLLSLSSDLKSNGNKILELITFYLRCLLDVLENIKNIRKNRTDNDCRFLYEREYKEFITTERWYNMKDTYIQTITKAKYHGIEPDVNELWNMHGLEFEKITNIAEFNDIESVFNDNAKLGRYIVEKEIPDTTSNPILNLFAHRGKQDIITEWINLKASEIPCCEPIDEQFESDFEYSEKFNEAKAIRIFPKIQALFNDKKAVDWVCYYHVLVFYTYVSFKDFNNFVVWLNKMANETLISHVNGRAINMTYWAKKAKKKWNIEELLAERNSKQAENQYSIYKKLCDEIRAIINQG